MAASNEHVEKVITVREPSADSIRYTHGVTWMEQDASRGGGVRVCQHSQALRKSYACSVSKFGD